MTSCNLRLPLLRRLWIKAGCLLIVAISGIEIEIFQLLVTREWVFNFSHHRGKTLCVERGEISEPAPAFEIFEEKIDRCPFATGINMML